ncbi:hypothetical protein EI94DRAFT_1834041 [Lactarius quietus]|nr:hypothetical protein EI94DRAFT_1834128 [Lactarius quietus]KAF8260112.1 hypothetical protein EI94DRAFT_1834041 [Lactarius quietus]
MTLEPMNRSEPAREPFSRFPPQLRRFARRSSAKAAALGRQRTEDRQLSSHFLNLGRGDTIGDDDFRGTISGRHSAADANIREFTVSSFTMSPAVASSDTEGSAATMRSSTEVNKLPHR